MKSRKVIYGELTMNREYDVAVVGATGAVGEAMISILEERNFPVRKLYLLASARSAGKSIMFHGKSVRVTDLAEFDFSQVQIGSVFCWREYFREICSDRCCSGLCGDR